MSERLEAPGQNGVGQLFDWDEREPLQRGVHRFVTTWHEGMKLNYEGAELGECLQYNLTQLCNHRVLAEMEKAQAERRSQ